MINTPKILSGDEYRVPGILGSTRDSTLALFIYKKFKIEARRDVKISF